MLGVKTQMKKRKKTLSRIITVISIAVLIVGVILILYCPVSNWLYNNAQNQITAKYDDTFRLDDNTESESSGKKDKPTTTSIDLEKLKKDILEYNLGLVESRQANLGTNGIFDKAVLNLSDYGFQDNIYGYVKIPKIDVNMPIYLGANDYNMSLGASHLGSTSIPYGGKDTHSVIAGHCGYGTLNHFRYLENLSKGDDVIIGTPFKKLKYKVIRKSIINPKDTQEFKIREGEDLVTLFTCYPYPKSTYRLCLICERKK